MNPSREEIDRPTLHAIQVKRIQTYIRDQVEKVKKDAFTAREEMIRQRSEKIEQVREKLSQTTLDIQLRHTMIKERLNQEAVFREANIRVSRGLEALEKFIQVLRDTQMEEEMIKKAIRDPIISSSLKSESLKIITSEFFQSVQRQLIMQTEFINIAAHELRTPIMPILLNVELLEEEVGKENPQIKIIIRNAKRLQRLTENILSVTRLESKSLALKKEVFNINELVNTLARDESGQPDNKKVTITSRSGGEAALVTADKDRISQVISNLLHNAIKFTEAGEIVISTTKDRGEVTVSVRDHGSGIDPKIMPILFSKFATKSDKGTGLGLYICKGIIEAHGGRIEGNNNPGPEAGAVFSFTLPLAGEDPDSEHGPKYSRQDQDDSSPA